MVECASTRKISRRYSTWRVVLTPSSTSYWRRRSKLPDDDAVKVGGILAVVAESDAVGAAVERHRNGHRRRPVPVAALHGRHDGGAAVDDDANAARIDR